MDYQKTGLLIASLRKEKGLTQKELADQLGITDRAVSKWERGLGCPDVSLLSDLSRILDISILEILKGRSLDKEEIVNNESIIESMTYSKEGFKHELKKYFNIISISLIILISLVLVVSNLKSIYYLNKTYRCEISNLDGEEIVNKVHNNIEIIKNKKGIYSDNDYAEILDYIGELQDQLNIEEDLKYIVKSNYTYVDMIDFHDNYFLSIQRLYKPTEMIYGLIHEHNPDIVGNMIDYYSYSRSIIESNFELYEALTNPYQYNKKINNEIVCTIQSILYRQYKRDNLLLEDIIKVGEINE